MGAGFRRVVALTAVGFIVLVLGIVGGGALGGSPAGPQTATFIDPNPRPAPALALTDAAGQPYALATLRGTPVLVFFGYTHCPDVCPASVGNIVQVINGFGPGLRAVFVTVDPERDTVASLADYVKFLPPGFAAVTGSATQIRSAADAWGVRYARVETGTPGSYSMTHTANVYLVDAAGMLRATFPFGTTAEGMLATVRQVVATSPTSGPSSIPSGHPGPTGRPTPTSSDAAAIDDLTAEVVSSSVWAGGRSPVILNLADAAGPLGGDSASVSVQLTTTTGGPTGSAVAAVAVRPPGVAAVSYVASLDIPTPGWWRLIVTYSDAGVRHAGETDVAALDPGTTAALGAAAPTVRTPTLADVGGDPRQVTTDPAPDLRLSRTSTADALAAHDAFVLVIDSTRFRVTSACGKALVMARFLTDRWPTVTFIHLEPFVYSIVTDTPVLDGTLTDPTLVTAAAGWGIGGAPWGPLSMPWVFVVDGSGTVRAKYQGVMGTADIDVILSLIEAGG